MVVTFGIRNLALTPSIRIIKMVEIFTFSYDCCAMGILIIIFRSEEGAGGG